jgi:hypothetical protein
MMSASDVRTPVSVAFGEPPWRYQGTEVLAAADPPDDEAARRLRLVAESGNWNDPLDAHDRAAELRGLTAAEILGLVTHIPLPTDEAWRERWGMGPAYWTRLTQAWACLGALYLDEDEAWRGSKRREILLRLLFGPEDWCVDAAAFALYTSALVNPDQRPDVAAAIGARYLHATLALGHRPTELHKPLAHVVLACPDMDAEVGAYARRMLAWQRASARDNAAKPPGPPVGRGETEVRRWADRLIASCHSALLPAPPPRRAWTRRSR